MCYIKNLVRKWTDCRLVIEYFFAVEEKKKATLVKINTAKTKVRSEITDLSNRLKESREMIQKMQQEVRVLESTSNQSAGS